MSLAGKPFQLERKCYEQIKFISPNLAELRKIADTLKFSPGKESNLKVENVGTAEEEREVFSEIVELCDKLQEHIDNIIVTVGRLGVFIQRSRGADEKFFTKDMTYFVGSRGERGCRRYPGKSMDTIVNASGAGDAFCAGFITAMLKHKTESICVSVGLQAARSSLLSEKAVPSTFFEAAHPCWTKAAEFQMPKL